MRFTTAQYLDYLNRTERNQIRSPSSQDAVEREEDLQDQIETFCKNKLWPFARTRMDKATTFTFPGVPDFIIGAPNGITLWVECKSKLGKPTPAQIGFGNMLNKNGHRYAVVRSFNEFLEMLKL